MKSFWMILVFTLCFSKLNGQSLYEKLNQRLVGISNFHETMRIVDSIYAIGGENLRDNGGDGLPKYKHWQRWAWYIGRRLDENGNMVDILKRKLELAEQMERDKSKNKHSRSSLPGHWEPIGCDTSSYSPNTTNSYANGTGRLDRIAFHPTDPNTFYVGAPIGGLWKTTDGGAHWKCLTDTIPSIGVSGIVVSYNNPNTIYILTGQGDGSAGNVTNNCQGVMKSTNAGVSWAFVGAFPTTPNFTTLVGFKLVQNPTNANILLAATNDGIFRTTNGGSSWTKTSGGLHYDIAFQPNSGTNALAATDDSLFYSTNGGVTWTLSARNIAPSPGPVRISIAFSLSEPTKVYAFHGNGGVANQFSGVYLSTDSGVNFTRLANTPNVLGYELNGSDAGSQASYDLCMAVHPDSTSRVMIGGVNIWRSSNGGVTFSNNTGWTETQGAIAYVHCDQHALAYNPLNNNLYSCNDGGIWVSSNSGNTWRNISKGLQTNMFYNLNQFKTNSTYILGGGLQDNGVKIRPAGTKNFTHIYGADGNCVAFQSNNPNIFYASSNATLIRFDYITGNGVIVTPVGMGGGKYTVTHPIDTNLVICSANGENIYRSTNKGISWTNVGGNGRVLTISQVDPTKLFAAGDSLVFRSTDTGNNWQLDTAGLGPNLNNLTLTDLESDPIDANYAYLTLGGFANGRKVYQTSNGGLTWSNISFNLPNVVVNSVAVTTSKIYIGTDITVYAMDWGGNTWIDIGDNIPHAPVIDILVDESKGIITVGTWGRGVWQRNYCIDNISLLGSLKGKLEYSANTMINASALIPGINDFDSIFMTSGKVLLQPGFRAKEGSHMKASIGSCDDGPQPFGRKRGATEAMVRKEEGGVIELKRD
ncbi:MAG: hypothetical protein IPO65_07350 [Saprospiraceae bacterium]|nr:hypothetical protein [Saprospiraceae bacterium]